MFQGAFYGGGKWIQMLVGLLTKDFHDSLNMTTLITLCVGLLNFRFTNLLEKIIFCFVRKLKISGVARRFEHL